MAKKRMAKKRLNKKLLVILLLAGMPILVVVGIAVDSRRPWLPKSIQSLMGRDSEKLLLEAQQLSKEVLLIEESISSRVKQKENPKEAYELKVLLQKEELEPKWKEVFALLGKAYKYARGDKELQKQILTQISEYHVQRGNRKAARGTWEALFKQDTSNYQAKREIVNYIYDLCTHSSSTNLYTSLKNHSDVLIELRPQEAYGYVTKAYADLKLLSFGATEDMEATFAEASDLLDRAMNLEEKNILAHRLRAGMALLKRRMSENEDEKAELAQFAEEILRQAISRNPDNSEAYLNLLSARLLPKYIEKRKLARLAVGEVKQEEMLASVQEYYEDVIAEIDESIERFPDEGEFYIIKSQLGLSQGKIKKASDYDSVIKDLNKAIACDAEKANRYAMLALIYIQRADYTDNARVDLLEAHKLLLQALYLPSAILDKDDYRYRTVIKIRFGNIIPNMIDVCVKLSALSTDDQSKPGYLELAQELHAELEETLGSDNPYTLASRGTISFAQGEFGEGLKSLYEADQQLSMLNIAPNNFRAELKWKLFKALRNTEYQTLAATYASRSLELGPRPASDLVEFMETLLKVEGNKKSLLQLLQTYENVYGLEDILGQRVLYVKAELLVKLGKIEEAREVVNKLEGDNKKIRLFRAMVKENIEERIAALREIERSDPGDSMVVKSLVNYHYAHRGEGEHHFKEARDIVAQALKVKPDNMAFQRMQLTLSEPDPNRITFDRSEEIALQVMEKIKDPFKKKYRLALHYEDMSLKSRSKGDDEAADKGMEKAKILYAEAAKIEKEGTRAKNSLFKMALRQKDWAKAEDLLKDLRQKDSLSGMLAESDLEIARENWSRAMEILENVLEMRPISVNGHLNLARVYRALGQDENAIEQARIAVSQDYTSIPALLLEAGLLHARVQRTGQFDDLMIILSLARDILEIEPGNIKATQLDIFYTPMQIKLLSRQIQKIQYDDEKAAKYQVHLEELKDRMVRGSTYLIKRKPNEIKNWIMLANYFYDGFVNAQDRDEQMRFLKQGDNVYQSAINQNPKSALLIMTFEEYLQKTGRGGGGMKLLTNLISETSGAEKYEAMLRLSSLYKNGGNSDQAVSILQELLKEDPQHVTARYELADLYSKKNQYDKSVEMFAKLHEERPDHDMILTHYIEDLLDAGRLEEAQPLVAKMKEKHPQDIKADLLSAKLALRNTNYAEAAAYADKALAKDPSSRLGYLMKADALFYDNRLEEAELALKELRGMESDDSNLGRIELANIYWQLMYYDDAIGELQMALSIDPTYSAARDLLVSWYIKLKRWDYLENYYSKTIKLFPKQVNLYIEAGQASMKRADQYEQMGQRRRLARQYEKALQLLGQGLRMSQLEGTYQREAYESMAWALVKVGRYQEAIKLISQFEQGSSGEVSLLMYKAEATYRMGEKAESLAMFEKILDLHKEQGGDVSSLLDQAHRVGDPDDILVWAQEKFRLEPTWTAMRLVMAKMYAAKGEKSRAISELNETLKKADENLSIRIESFLWELYWDVGRKSKAIEVCRSLAQKIPQDADIANNLAYLLMEVGGRDDEAIEIAKKAYDLARTNPLMMDTYAMALLRLKKYSEAELIMLKLIQEVQRNRGEVTGEYEYHLAQALLGKGQIEEANDHLDAALNLLPEGGTRVDEEMREKIMALQRDM